MPTSARATSATAAFTGSDTPSCASTTIGWGPHCSCAWRSAGHRARLCPGRLPRLLVRREGRGRRQAAGRPHDESEGALRCAAVRVRAPVLVPRVRGGAPAGLPARDPGRSRRPVRRPPWRSARRLHHRGGRHRAGRPGRPARGSAPGSGPQKTRPAACAGRSAEPAGRADTRVPSADRRVRTLRRDAARILLPLDGQGACGPHGRPLHAAGCPKLSAADARRECQAGARTMEGPLEPLVEQVGPSAENVLWSPDEAPLARPRPRRPARRSGRPSGALEAGDDGRPDQYRPGGAGAHGGWRAASRLESARDGRPPERHREPPSHRDRAQRPARPDLDDQQPGGGASPTPRLWSARARLRVFVGGHGPSTRTRQ